MVGGWARIKKRRINKRVVCVCVYVRDRKTKGGGAILAVSHSHGPRRAGPLAAAPAGCSAATNALNASAAAGSGGRAAALLVWG